MSGAAPAIDQDQLQNCRSVYAGVDPVDWNQGMTASPFPDEACAPAAAAACPPAVLFAPDTAVAVLCDEWARHCRAAVAMSAGITQAWVKAVAAQQETAMLVHRHALYLYPVAGGCLPPVPGKLMAIAMEEGAGLALGNLRGGLEFLAGSQSNLLACLQEHYGNPFEYLQDLQDRLSADVLLQAEEGMHVASPT